jgi:hypothetical protein
VYMCDFNCVIFYFKILCVHCITLKGLKNYKEVNLSTLHHGEEKLMIRLFHIKIQVNNTKVDSLFDFGS